MKYSPNSNDASANFSSSNTSKAAIDTAHAIGFPPNVEPCEPGLKTPKISSFATTHEIGNTPPPNAFPQMYISGSNPSQSVANILPVLQRPARISSATNNTSCFLHRYTAADITQSERSNIT